MSGATPKMQPVRFPVSPDQVQQPHDGEIANEAGRSTRETEKPSVRLLLFDHDSDVLEFTLSIFGPDSYEVVFEDSLAKFRLALMVLQPVNVVIINLENPLETYFDLMSYVKEVAPETEVIFISKLAEDELWIESIQRGAYDLLPKPLVKSEFYRVVNNAIEKHRPT